MYRCVVLLFNFLGFGRSSFLGKRVCAVVMVAGEVFRCRIAGLRKGIHVP